MLALVSGVAETLYKDPDAYGKRKAQVQDFARAHPIQGTYYSSRETALVALARLVESDDSGLLSGLGQATDTLADISLRLNSYVTLLPKVASWQAELTSEGVTGRENLGRTLDEVDAIGEMARRASGLLADLPGAARQASGPIGELLDRQRVEVLAAIDRERQDLTGFVSSEREAALSAVGEERRAALEASRRNSPPRWRASTRSRSDPSRTPRSGCAASSTRLRACPDPHRPGGALLRRGVPARPQRPWLSPRRRRVGRTTGSRG